MSAIAIGVTAIQLEHSVEANGFLSRLRRKTAIVRDDVVTKIALILRRIDIRIDFCVKSLFVVQVEVEDYL